MAFVTKITNKYQFGTVLEEQRSLLLGEEGFDTELGSSYLISRILVTQPRRVAAREIARCLKRMLVGQRLSTECLVSAMLDRLCEIGPVHHLDNSALQVAQASGF
eukprot:6484193-Amphidinium_carterae.2